MSSFDDVIVRDWKDENVVFFKDENCLVVFERNRDTSSSSSPSFRKELQDDDDDAGGDQRKFFERAKRGDGTGERFLENFERRRGEENGRGEDSGYAQ